MIILFLEFFKIGLFSIGGGLATLPFLYDLANKYNWFDINLIGDMIAISESTPGPIGINMATYVGFLHSNFIGSIVATTGLIVPPFIIIIIVSKFLSKFKKSKYIKEIFEFIRPVVTGLIASSALLIVSVGILDKNYFIKEKELILFFVMFFAISKFKKSPIIYILLSIIIGILFKF